MRFNPAAFKTAQGRIAAPAVNEPAPGEPSTALSGQSFITHFGRPGANPVQLPTDRIGVTIGLKFNDSAPQVDHFDYHAPLGCPAFLLLLAKKQPRTEALARHALSLGRELHLLDWTWHTENYAGGHGNYLQSSPISLPFPVNARHTCTSIPVTKGFWEIEFTASHPGHLLELPPHKHYGATSLLSSQTPDPGPQTRITAAWRLNDALHGIEVHFTRRPDDAALAPFRDRGTGTSGAVWRYSGRSQCWYAKQTPATLDFAKTYCDEFNAGDPCRPFVPVPAGRPATAGSPGGANPLGEGSVQETAPNHILVKPAELIQTMPTPGIVNPTVPPPYPFPPVRSAFRRIPFTP
jgi:hypothetical protein